MAQRTAQPRAAAGSCPPDVTVMRETVRLLLAPDAAAPPPAELDALTAVLRGHLAVLAPDVAALAARLPEDDVPRYCALACVGEAGGKLRAGPGTGQDAALRYAHKLARSLAALCDHYVSLTPPCDEPDPDTAYRRLLEHGAACASCRAVDETGRNAGVSCGTRDHLHDAYRKARSAACTA
ncbi:DUF6415 family natural product biosynthesis protein [Streptomyces violaceoruber]|uniref:DUF6415 family natural product biosynthesis protein n=1 Tax=Streptomyces violaceoruber TaxID=1935 RepID=A0ACD4WQL8_STRVN|nr:DUF6415 family natural product biosynthesis protein [Streptomyces violaceoruber]BDD73002.1 hypothetical protein JCM4020_36220 [Streptomyces coelicolor]